MHKFFGEKLKELREIKGITTKQLVDLINENFPDSYFLDYEMECYENGFNEKYSLLRIGYAVKSLNSYIESLFNNIIPPGKLGVKFRTILMAIDLYVRFQCNIFKDKLIWNYTLNDIFDFNNIDLKTCFLRLGHYINKTRKMKDIRRAELVKLYNKENNCFNYLTKRDLKDLENGIFYRDMRLFDIELLISFLGTSLGNLNFQGCWLGGYEKAKHIVFKCSLYVDFIKYHNAYCDKSIEKYTLDDII